jgi:hypothetical protein
MTMDCIIANSAISDPIFKESINYFTFNMALTFSNKLYRTERISGNSLKKQDQKKTLPYSSRLSLDPKE